MHAAALFYPLFAMFALSATTLGILFSRRVRAVREKRVSITYFGTYQGSAEPAETAQAARHFTNLFEAPVLFYAAVLSAMTLSLQSTAVLALAWAYVAARVVHSWIHLGSNRIGPRLRSYFVSWLLLAALWLTLLFQLATRTA